MSTASAPEWSLPETAYDAIAPRYPRVIIENRINAYMRRQSVGHLVAAFSPGDHVLELGCGTGDEALELAQRGVHVVALDPSAAMLRIAREKARALRLDGRVRFIQAKASDLPMLQEVTGTVFDGAYASFSLAYEPNLRRCSHGLHNVLRQKALLIASVPSRLCMLEWLLALASGKPSLAGRRLSPSYGHRVGSCVVPITPYTPQELARLLAPEFELDSVQALPVLVPPPYMNQWYSKFHSLADMLERADNAVRGQFPFRYVGDHFVARLQHVGGFP